MEKQKTIEREVALKGVGLHTGNSVTVTFKPAGPDEGVNFIRVDLPSMPVIKASVENIFSQVPGGRRTTIGNGEIQVATVEHMMAALSGRGIDNINIEIDNSEAPGLDGSSLNYLEALESAGIKEQEKERQCFSVKETVFVEEDGASIIAVPSGEFRISYTLNYDHTLLKAQFLEAAVNAGTFKAEFAPARTFCLEAEAEELKRQGLGKGANYDNTLVVGKNGVIRNKLRFEDEFVRHKMLDLIGDLYLLGGPLKGHIIAVKSGHSLNLKLLRKLAQQRQRNVSAGISANYNPQALPSGELDVNEIKKILPHREPFLFIDKIISLEKGKHATGIKNLTINDYFFKGHFPEKPVMPGVLIVEAMAQVGGVMMLAPEENRGKLAFFLAADNIKFRKTVLPGDQLVLDVTAGKIKTKTGQVHGKAFVDGKLVAEADLMFALVES